MDVGSGGEFAVQRERTASGSERYKSGKPQDAGLKARRYNGKNHLAKGDGVGRSWRTSLEDSAGLVSLRNRAEIY